MRLLVPTTILFAALTMVAPPSAEAVEFGFTCVTSNSPANCLSGAAQFAVGVTEGASGRIKFDFRNYGPAPSSIETIYFDGAPWLQSIYKITNYAGTDFEEGATPPQMPGRNLVTPVFDTDFAVGAEPPPSEWGINPGEHLRIHFTLASGVTFDDAIDAMTSGAIRIGIHAIAWTDGKSDAFITQGPFVRQVPEPPAILLFGGVLLVAAHVLRRRWLHHPAGK